MTEEQAGGSAAAAPHRNLPSRLRAFAVLHPAPSAVNAALVACLALLAAAEPWTAAVLAVAMFGFQVSIGALNDIVDAGDDRRAGRDKPIPGGRVPVRVASAIVIGGGIAGLAISASFGLAVLVVGAVGYGAGIAYDVGMRRAGLGWLCFAVAFPALLAWTWLAAADTLPPGWPFLLPLAALAGPAIHLANGLVDADSDERVGVTNLATRLGPWRSRWILTGLSGAVYVLGWTVLASLPDLHSSAILVAAFATATALIGVGLSWLRSRRLLEAGWMAQAVGLAALAVAWAASLD